MPCTILCFDITGFFDHLDHRILKERLKRILGAKELPSDWYAVFRAVSRYSSIERNDLESHITFGPRLSANTRDPIATISEIKDAGIAITQNPDPFGIPQGTPISSVFSNLYLIDLDAVLLDSCTACGALYRRYSDDILIICPLGNETALAALVQNSLADHRLTLAADKTDIRQFDAVSPSAFQYLGFNISPNGAVIRPSSLARQWRKAKRAIERTKKAGLAAIALGKADRIFVKKLRRRFSPVGSRNFCSYSRRSAQAFGAKKINRQVARLEAKIDLAIRELQKP
jgi:hypothetical protein